MRPRKIFFVIVAIAFWMLLTYIIVTKQTGQNEAKRKELLKQVELIEMEAHDKMEERKYLLEQVEKILKMKELPDIISTPAPTMTTKKGEEEEPRMEENEIENAVNDNPLSQYTEIYLENDRSRPVIPVLVFACNRPSISKCLDNLVEYRPNKEQFPIIVSQDCGDELTKETILKYDVTLIEQPDTSVIQVPPKDKKFLGYYKISRHYGWALTQVFSRGFEFVIIVEGIFMNFYLKKPKKTRNTEFFRRFKRLSRLL